MEKLGGVARPVGLLNNWLETYGYDKHRTTGDDCSAMCYVSVQTYDDDESSDEWHLVGISKDPQEVLVEGFMDILKMLVNDYGKGRMSMNINGVVLVSHGEGFYVSDDPKTGEPVLVEDCDDEIRARAAEVGVTEGAIPVRMVNAITPSGLVGEVTMFQEGKEPQVEVIEQWLGNNETPEPLGVVDEALMALMTFVLLARQVVSENLPMNAKSLLEVAMAGDQDNETTAYVLKVVSMAIKAGVLSVEDLRQ
jgi:hypothetical protein